ncbi:MAG: hypothetical protein ABL889_16225 [Terricaulis sp.]
MKAKPSQLSNKLAILEDFDLGLILVLFVNIFARSARARAGIHDEFVEHQNWRL